MSGYNKNESSTIINGQHEHQQRSRRITIDNVTSKSMTADDTNTINSVLTSTTSSSVNCSSVIEIVKLVLLNMLVCGIELCASAGYTYLPPMLLKAGYGEQSMTFVMGIGPFLALMTVPFLGRWSDRCRSSIGHRRPLIISLAILMIISLIFLSHGHMIGHFLAPGNVDVQKVLLVLGIVLLDYGCHAGFNPCEALVADVMELHPENKEIGFTVYSTMISIGGCIGYIITAVDWPSTSSGLLTSGSQERGAFSVILIIYIITVMITIFAATDDSSQPPPSSEKNLFPTYGAVSNVDVTGNYSSIIYIKKENANSDDVGYETGSNDSNDGIRLPKRPLIHSNSEDDELRGGHSKTTKLNAFKSTLRTFIKRFYRDWLFFILRLPRRLFASRMTAIHFQVTSIFNVPLVLRRLFVADFCSWTALLCLYIFYTDYVGRAVYGGTPSAELDGNSIGSQLYEDGIRMGSWGLLLHSITCICYVNTVQKFLIRTYGLRRTYMIGLAIFTASVTLTLMTSNLTIILGLAAISGTGFGATTTIPNMLVAAYHSDKTTFIDVNDHQDDEIRQSWTEVDRGLASDFSILDSAYFLSQIFLSLSVGSIVNFTNSVTTYIVISASFGLLACYFSTRVIFPKRFTS